MGDADVEWLGDVEFSDDRRVRVTPEAVTFVGGTITLLAAFVYHWSIRGGRFSYVPLVFGWSPTRIDWLTMFAGVVVIAGVVVPVVRDPSIIRDYWRAYPADAVSRWSLAITALVVLTGTVGPALLSVPATDLQGTYQPPVGFSVPAEYVSDCVGQLSADSCRGSPTHPLGTAGGGEDMLAWIAYGARTVVTFVALSTAITVPIGVGVGLAAAASGGIVERALMGYVDVQTTIPTILLYLLITFFDGVTLFGLVVAYGVFNWGGLARVVRTAARDELQSEYVEAGRSAGAGTVHVLRRHILPNVADTVIIAVTLGVPKLVLIEVGLAFLGFGGEDTYSWGQLLQRGLLGGGLEFGVTWWIVTVPAITTALFVLAVGVVGDGLRTALDG